MNGINRRRPTLESETDAYLRVKVRKGWSERHARGHSRDHTTSMQSEESRRVTDNGGRVEPTKRQARTKGEVGRLPMSVGSMRASNKGSISLPTLCVCVCVCVHACVHACVYVWQSKAIS